jgi:hypothetical protein
VGESGKGGGEREAGWRNDPMYAHVNKLTKINK